MSQELDGTQLAEAQRVLIIRDDIASEILPAGRYLIRFIRIAAPRDHGPHRSSVLSVQPVDARKVPTGPLQTRATNSARCDRVEVLIQPRLTDAKKVD